jgi:putative RecB family exonuclease
VNPYSHSRLSAYENCPRQFSYRYVEKIPVETESVESFLGRRVHELLERLYHHLLRYGRPPSLRQVLDRYARDWEVQWQERRDRVVIVRGDLGEGDFRQRGARCLENYYRAHYPFSAEETIGIEQRVQLQLHEDGRYPMVGIVDRIARIGPGRYEIHDYKTSSRLPTQPQIDRERQLALYQIGLEQTYGAEEVQEVELVWHYLLHNRTLRSRRTPEQLARLRDETIALIDEIESAAEYRPRPGPLCAWCEYNSLCPAASNPSRAPEALAEPLEALPVTPPAPPSGPQQLSLLD